MLCAALPCAGADGRAGELRAAGRRAFRIFESQRGREPHYGGRAYGAQMLDADITMPFRG